MENFYHNLMLNIANCFVTIENEQEKLKNWRNMASLIRIHNKNFAQAGEASFPCDPNLWEKYFPAAKGLQLNKEAFEFTELEDGKCKLFLEEARKWSFPLLRLDVRKERCHLYLQRCSVIGNLIQQVLSAPNYGCLKKAEDTSVYVKPLQKYGLNDQDLSFHRVKLIHQTLQKLLLCSKYSIVQELESSTLSIDVLSVASNIAADDIKKSAVNIRCGPVTYPLTDGEVCQLSTEQYLNCRSEHIRKMALFRSRKVVQEDACFNALMDRLGCADVTVSLLEVKHTSPVQIRTIGMGGTRGALFLLYNSARLETILRTFEERIQYHEYERQPDMKDIDWSVLNEEEEWQLVFTYIAGFPDLIDRCVEQLKRGIFAAHLIIHFLNGLVALFSKYYIRIRILTEKRDHLMPYVYARIYLLRAVREILNKTLSFLDIKPVESM